jgi:hypothetical protein
MEIHNIINNLLIIFNYIYLFLIILLKNSYWLSVAIYYFILKYKLIVLQNIFFIIFWFYYQQNLSYYNNYNLENKNIISEQKPISTNKKYPIANKKYKISKNINNKRLAKYKINKGKLNIHKKILYKLNDAPKNLSIINYKLSEIPPNIIEFVTRDNYKLNDNKLLALGAYLIAKGLFIKMFRTKSHSLDIITNLNSFSQLYKKYIQLEPLNAVGYNFCLKLYNQYNTKKKYSRNSHDNYDNYDNIEYLYLSNETIIKIKKINPYLYIERRLEINNLFIMKNDNNVILSYGSFIIIDVNPELLNDFFYNSNNLSQIKKYYKYNKMKIMYWTSVFT